MGCPCVSWEWQKNLKEKLLSMLYGLKQVIIFFNGTKIVTFSILSSTTCFIWLWLYFRLLWNWFRIPSCYFAYSSFILHGCWFSFLVFTRTLSLWSKLILSWFEALSVGWSISVMFGLSVLMHLEFWYGQNHRSIGMLSLMGTKCLCM